MLEKNRDIEDNFDAFNDYVLKYDFKDNMIEYKYNHSYRVMSASEKLAKSIKLSKDDTYLAMLIGLLHDIGRFEQQTITKSFTDTNGFDHSEYGVKVLFEDGLINKFILSFDEYEIVRKAILYHNDYTLDDKELTEREEIFCKLIRDADKIDILYAFSTTRILEIEEDESEISEKIKESFFNNECSDNRNISGKNDLIISFWQFIYDLNFDESYKIIYEEDYIGKMFESLKNKKRFNMYYETIEAYLREKVK